MKSLFFIKPLSMALNLRMVMWIETVWKTFVKGAKGQAPLIIVANDADKIQVFRPQAESGGPVSMC